MGIIWKGSVSWSRQIPFGLFQSEPVAVHPEALGICQKNVVAAQKEVALY